MTPVLTAEELKENVTDSKEIKDYKRRKREMLNEAEEWYEQQKQSGK